MAGKNRLLAKILGNNEGVITPDSDTLAIALTKNISSAAGIMVYSSIDDLPSSSSAGEKALVTSTNTLYLYNSGWYKIALINNFNPQWVTQPAATYDLAINSTPTVITMLATDSDDVPIRYVATTDSGFNSIATVSHDSDKHNVFTIIPTDSENGAATGGTGTITFKATDGVNQVQQVSTFSLTFGPDWTGTVTDTVITASVAAQNSNFGRTNAISADGTMLICGAPNYDTGSYSNQGAWYYFTRSGSTWTQQQLITTVTGGLAAQYTLSDGIDMTSDGTYAAVGASYNGGAGKIHVYTRSGNTWTEQAAITASDNNTNGNFGTRLKMNSNGNYIVASDSTIPSTHYGTAYIFARSGSSWSEQAKITHPVSSSNYDMFGLPGEINNDGTQALFSCAYEDDNGSNAGAVYAYSRSGSTWTYNQKIVASDAAASSRFGTSMSMDDAGDYVVIGAPYADSNAGAVYVFTRSGSTWTQQQRIGMPGLATGSPNFGGHVNMNSTGTFMTVSAPYYDGNSGAVTNSGVVYLYERSGTTWSLTYTFEDSPLEASSSYGGGDNSVSSDGSYVLVPRATVNTYTGELHVYSA